VRLGKQNPYGFVLNDPSGDIDPWGLMTIQQIMEMIAKAEQAGDDAAVERWTAELAEFLRAQEAARAGALAAEQTAATAAVEFAPAYCSLGGAIVGLIDMSMLWVVYQAFSYPSPVIYQNPWDPGNPYPNNPIPISVTDPPPRPR
jgi:uncharacterized protein RhaS with RHS repeats